MPNMQACSSPSINETSPWPFSLSYGCFVQAVSKPGFVVLNIRPENFTIAWKKTACNSQVLNYIEKQLPFISREAAIAKTDGETERHFSFLMYYNFIRHTKIRYCTDFLHLTIASWWVKEDSVNLIFISDCNGEDSSYKPHDFASFKDCY